VTPTAARRYACETVDRGICTRRLTPLVDISTVGRGAADGAVRATLVRHGVPALSAPLARPDCTGIIVEPAVGFTGTGWTGTVPVVLTPATLKL